VQLSGVESVAETRALHGFVLYRISTPSFRFPAPDFSSVPWTPCVSDLSWSLIPPHVCAGLVSAPGSIVLLVAWIRARFIDLLPEFFSSVLDFAARRFRFLLCTPAQSLARAICLCLTRLEFFSSLAVFLGPLAL
jgi:hypothetical protein